MDQCETILRYKREDYAALTENMLSDPTLIGNAVCLVGIMEIRQSEFGKRNFDKSAHLETHLGGRR